MTGLEQARSAIRAGRLAAPAFAAILAERVILAAALLMLVVQEFVFSVYTVDDAFISFRYARNLASGLGLVFNPGERVEGYTNFLWTILMAGGYRLGLDLVVFAKLVGIAASLGTVYVLFKLCIVIRPSSARVGSRSLAALLLAANGSFATAAITGLETSLFVLLITAGAYFYVRQGRSDAAAGRRGWSRLRAGDLSAICFALSAMTRPEGVAVFAFGLLLLPLSNGFKTSTLTACARWGGIFAAIYLPYYLWRFSYYGYPFPNTFYAKTGAGIGQYVKGLIDLGLFSSTYYAFLLPPALFVLARRGRSALTPFLALLTVLYVVIVVLGLLSPPFLALVFIVALLILIRHKAASWLTYVAGLTLFYVGINVYEGGDWIPFFRMVMPILPLYYLLLQEGFVRAWTSFVRGWLPDARERPCQDDQLSGHISVPWSAGVLVRRGVERDTVSLSRNRFATWLPYGLPAALVLATLWPSVGMVWKLNNDAVGYQRAHRALGEWLASNAHGPIALMDIGLVGYLSHLEIVDTSGLTDLHIAHAPGGMIDKEFDLAHVLDRDPEYVVLASTTDFVAAGENPTDFPIDRRIYEEERFARSYRHVFTLDQGWREKGKGYFLTVFERR